MTDNSLAPPDAQINAAEPTNGLTSAPSSASLPMFIASAGNGAEVRNNMLEREKEDHVFLASYSTSSGRMPAFFLHKIKFFSYIPNSICPLLPFTIGAS